MKKIILLLGFMSFYSNAQINAPDRDYNSIQNRENRGELGYKPSATSTSTSGSYRSNTQHYNTFAPVNTELTKEQLEAWGGLFGLNRKT
jgi:hypothetical protein